VYFTRTKNLLLMRMRYT